MDFEATNRQHNKRIRAFEKLVKEIFNLSNEEAIKLAKSVDYDAKKLFKFSDYPEIRKKANKLFSQFQKDLKKVIVNGATSEWENSNLANNQLALNVMNLKSLEEITANQRKYFNNNQSASNAFLRRKIMGLDLSDRVWNLTQQYKVGLEQALTVGIADGRSAAELSRDIREYLNNPNKLFRRVRDFENRLNLSSRAKEYQPGQGIYRSSFKNALRLTGTEINMAYRTADYYRWLQLDFVVGVEIKLSNNHTIKDPRTGKSIPFYDMCDELQGKYPKTFKFTGWHPNCYDEETEVLTKRGWQYFKYITKEDRIFSLNPETKETEWVEILLYFKRLYNGEMVHFYNRNLDCLVTPEHEVVYLNKSNQEIKRCKAIDFTMGKGAFFRGCKNNNNPIKTMTQFNKELIDYHGYVYDVTLSKNAIMYIRRNGKCFWGSNCRCFAIPILKSREEFFNKTKSSREVKEIPQNFKEWISKNKERISKAKSIPYFIRDNKSLVSSLNNTNQEMK